MLIFSPIVQRSDLIQVVFNPWDPTQHCLERRTDKVRTESPVVVDAGAEADHGGQDDGDGAGEAGEPHVGQVVDGQVGEPVGPKEN